MRRSPVTGSSPERLGAGRRCLRLIHCNNTRGDLPCGLVLHEHTGMGFIGEDGFRWILRHEVFYKLPLVCGTPFDDWQDDRGNIAKEREPAG